MSQTKRNPKAAAKRKAKSTAKKTAKRARPVEDVVAKMQRTLLAPKNMPFELRLAAADKLLADGYLKTDGAYVRFLRLPTDCVDPVKFQAAIQAEADKSLTIIRENAKFLKETEAELLAAEVAAETTPIPEVLN